jgi:hypothetical protein
MLVRICWGVTAAIAGFSLLTFASDLNNAASAPQQAAAAAMTLAWVVMPYVLTRSIEGMFPRKEKSAPASANTHNISGRDIAEGQY